MINYQDIFKGRITRIIDVDTRFLVKRNEPFLLDKNRVIRRVINVAKIADYNKKICFFKYNSPYSVSRKFGMFGADLGKRFIPKMQLKFERRRGRITRYVLNNET
jgi:hypothetical protein